MKALVTGGAGFVGANICEHLLEQGIKVVCLDDFLKGSEENIHGMDLELVKGSVVDEGLIRSLKGKGIDVIFHEAAITDTTVIDDDLMLRVNVEGFKYVLDLARNENSSVVYASSAAVYGDCAVAMKENQKPNPLNIYGVSKLKMDEISPVFTKETGLNVVGLRYFNVYGPKEDFKANAMSMIRQLANQMLKGNPPRIFKWGEQERDFVYVKDVVLANIKAFEAKTSCIVNVGTGVRTNFNRVIDILNDNLNMDFKPEYFDNPYSFYQNHTQADLALAQSSIDFKAGFSIEEGIKDYILKLKKV
ncbi:MAG: ADP-glyceromanno-heptose 6-epimerase [Candidatus Gygaella obscura]|nr:ADP-glyceromanno-heptose 6-epimerase [Candidatus Gygaella obscura]